jgi:[acyl-carrier-protein] S-malonyltransferase
MTNYALLFPGQGSQYIGMGKGLFTTQVGARLFEEAQDVLSLPLKRLMFEGPADELTATAIAQPAILLHSTAAYFYIRENINPSITCALGHSLGEFSALVAAEVISFADAIKTVHIRGQYMQEVVPKGRGAMAAVIGMDSFAIALALEEFKDETRDDYVSCANFNGPMQTVIAGTTLGIKKASEKLKSLGITRIIDLPVSAPFHCALMKPVQRKMTEVLLAIYFADPKFPIISNVSAKIETNGKKIRDLLLAQITSPVRFTDCVMHIKEQGLEGSGFLELGPRNALSGIVKKIDRSFLTLNVDTPEDIAALRNKEYRD